MRHIVASTAAMLAIASPISPISPAWAWTNTTNGAGPQQIVDGGPGAQSAARASAGAVAVANQRVVVRVNPAPSGASTGAGSAGTAAGSGGAGSGGSSTGPGAGAGSYNGATYIDNRAAPSIGLAPLYGGGARCPTVGLTGAGSATGGGGGAGVSWYSSDCSTIEMAEYMRSIGRGDVGQALLAHHYPELAQVLADMPAVVPAAVAPVPVVRPAWCDKAQRNRHPTEASAAYIARECE